MGRISSGICRPYFTVGQIQINQEFPLLFCTCGMFNINLNLIRAYRKRFKCSTRWFQFGFKMIVAVLTFQDIDIDFEKDIDNLYRFKDYLTAKPLDFLLTAYKPRKNSN